jgi:hypothetical protein
VDPRAVLDDLVEEEIPYPRREKKPNAAVSQSFTYIKTTWRHIRADYNRFVEVASTYIKAGNMQDGWNT